jgi:hypothetical protein
LGNSAIEYNQWHASSLVRVNPVKDVQRNFIESFGHIVFDLKDLNAGKHRFLNTATANPLD